MNQDIIAQALRVHEARTRHHGLTTEMDALIAEFERQHLDLIAARSEARDTLAAEEAALRALTITYYQAQGKAALPPCVGVRLVTRLDYAPEEAFVWAQKHGLALKLNVAVFERLAKDVGIPCVTITQEPQATIATDLGKHLAEPTEIREECD